MGDGRAYAAQFGEDGKLAGFLKLLFAHASKEFEMAEFEMAGAPGTDKGVFSWAKRQKGDPDTELMVHLTTLQ